MGMRMGKKGYPLSPPNLHKRQRSLRLQLFPLFRPFDFITEVPRREEVLDVGEVVGVVAEGVFDCFGLVLVVEPS